MPNPIRTVLWRFAETWDHVCFTFVAWIDTRPYHRLLAGAPALLLAIAMVALALRGHLGGDERDCSHYNQLFLFALDEDDPAAAELWARKLVQLDASTSEAVFGQAWLAQRRGDTVAYAQLLQQLAPDDQPGHPRAHLWHAKSLLHQGQQATVDPNVVVHHLRQALAEPSQRQTTRELLAAVFIARQDFPAAIEQLNALVGRRPDLRWKLSQLYTAAGQPDRARDELQRALEFYREVAQQQPGDSGVQISWAQAEAAAGDFKRAEAILLAGVQTDRQDEFRTALSALYVAMANRLARDDADKMGERLRLLERALHYTPSHQAALIRLASIVQAGEHADESRQLLQDALAQGTAPAFVHLLLGTAAASARDWPLASMHLRQAHRLDPDSPVLLNNLAWVLASSDPPQLELALPLVNAAIKLSPQHPEIRATRGHILARLERWNDALAELELALGTLPPRPQLHQTLAEVYTALGNETLAARHQQLSVEPTVP